jgi:cytidylate kinase
VRARRRAQQLRQAGQSVDEGRLLQEIIDRDRRDSSRSDGPLICPADATRIDTTDMSMGGVVDRLEGEVRARIELPSGPGGKRGGAEHG